ncbi:MSHA biogenesis protein MshJ [Aeromonas sp. RU39B]|uniref:type 4a pilus biogenesis protein PilO n=1 Tax=Aeromonas sp. RU39B TaxID=1907416 RepID=UPI0009559B62|nr:type 4a pilus biogenesis protein PilO [Aeromonas sp. RU39B]SIR54727.1 MSHA biogenesis protein MshJ [Aeromonas sp. RU39B]
MSLSIKAQWQQLAERVGGLSLRERALILLTGVVLLVMGLNEWWLTPQWQQNQKVARQLESERRDLEIVGLEIQGKQARLARDPDAEVRQQLSQAGRELSQLEQQLREQTVDLIAAEEMPGVLQAMLSHGEGLRMLEMQSQPPEPLLPKEQNANLYRHQITLVLEGGYFDVYRYLQALEGLPRHFYWRLFDYQVTDWPKARVELQIYTLSTSKEFIRG